ncbi:hypothetical protein MMC26_007366 [Xylographa opegraphella]|nr:hypothetical protein [Xylographa opegraphella]
MLFDGLDGPIDDPDADKGPLLVNVSAAMVALSCIAVFLRFVARWVSRTPILADDFLLVAALPFTWATAANTIYGVLHNNLGTHLKLADLGNVRSFLLALYIFAICYSIGLAFIKFSILAFLFRVFHVPTFKLPLSITAAIVTITTVASLFTAIFSCHPIQGFWDLEIPSTCIDPLKFYFAQAIPSIITDIILLILPLPVVWKLKVTRSQKWGLSAVFLLGGFVTICSIIRLVRLIQIQDNLDFTWGLSDPALWSTVEMHIFVCCACLPSTWCLIKLLLDRKIGSYSFPITWTGSKKQSFIGESQGMIRSTDSPAHHPRSGSIVTSVNGSPERLTLGSQFRREKNWPLSPFEEPEMSDAVPRKSPVKRDVEWADDDGLPPALPEKDDKWAKLGTPTLPPPAMRRFLS